MFVFRFLYEHYHWLTKSQMWGNTSIKMFQVINEKEVIEYSSIHNESMDLGTQ